MMTSKIFPFLLSSKYTEKRERIRRKWPNPLVKYQNLCRFRCATHLQNNPGLDLFSHHLWSVISIREFVSSFWAGILPSNQDSSKRVSQRKKGHHRRWYSTPGQQRSSYNHPHSKKVRRESWSFCSVTFQRYHLGEQAKGRECLLPSLSLLPGTPMS